MTAGVQSAVTGGCGLAAQSCLTLCDPWTVARQAPLSMGFSGQEYLSGSPFPSPEDLPGPEIEPTTPALGSLLLSRLGAALEVVLLDPFSLCILTTPP